MNACKCKAESETGANTMRFGVQAPSAQGAHGCAEQQGRPEHGTDLEGTRRSANAEGPMPIPQDFHALRDRVQRKADRCFARYGACAECSPAQRVAVCGLCGLRIRVCSLRTTD